MAIISIIVLNNSKKWEYPYCSRENIESKKEYTVCIDKNDEKVYTLKANGEDTYSYDTTWQDKLTSYNGQTITYDASGNPLNYMGHNLTWTMGRQLASYDNITYSYNENGIRTGKTVNGVTTKFYLDGTRIIEMNNGTNPLHFLYDRNNEVIGFFYCGQTYLYAKNLQGDITAIINDEGFLIARYTYDDWGNCTVYSAEYDYNNIANLNPLRYRSYYYDVETGLYYLQSRYYDPEVGRFINCDDVNYIGASVTELSYNAFAYCENDPVNGIDYKGLKKEMSMMQLIVIYKRLKPYLPIIIEYLENDEIAADVNASNPPDHPNFKAPKGGNRKVKNPNGKGNGWLAKDGGVWIWTPKMHGGKGWTVQYPNGSHSHAYKGGKMRNHFVVEKPNIKDRIIVASLVLLAIAMLADDATGVGVINDAPALACLVAVPNIKKKVCSVCGEVIYEF